MNSKKSELCFLKVIRLSIDETQSLRGGAKFKTDVIPNYCPFCKGTSLTSLASEEGPGVYRCDTCGSVIVKD